MRPLICALFAIACEPAAQVERAEPPALVEHTVDRDGWITVGHEVVPKPAPVAIRPEPPGFDRVDEYTSHDEACTGEVSIQVPEDRPAWQRAILLWCEHRSYHASRYQIVKSKVDGSQIHDRDRPTAWIFWERAVADGTLDPDACPFHAVNRKLKHTGGCRRLMRGWADRFKRPKLTDKMRRQWYAHPHDVERFGARGPHDWNANAYRVLPGCWDPKQLERFDVSIHVTVKRSLQICEREQRCTVGTIKAHW
jgi:hypothetical protein